MKKHFVLAPVFFMAFMMKGMAQSDQVFTIEPGEKIIDAIPLQGQYFSKNFVNGLLWMKDGRLGRAEVNYNYLFGEMMFINEKKDTLAFASPQDFKLFALGNDTFYFSNKTYLREIGNYGNLKLGEKSYFGVAEVKKIGAMGVETSGVSIDQFRQMQYTSTGMKDLTVQEKTIVKRISVYYIGDADGNFKPANRKNILKMATGKESADLKNYMDSNKVNFSKKEDLVALLSVIQK